MTSEEMEKAEAYAKARGFTVPAKDHPHDPPAFRIGDVVIWMRHCWISARIIDNRYTAHAWWMDLESALDHFGKEA